MDPSNHPSATLSSTSCFVPDLGCSLYSSIAFNSGKVIFPYSSKYQQNYFLYSQVYPPYLYSEGSSSGRYLFLSAVFFFLADFYSISPLTSLVILSSTFNFWSSFKSLNPRISAGSSFASMQCLVRQKQMRCLHGQFLETPSSQHTAILISPFSILVLHFLHSDLFDGAISTFTKSALPTSSFPSPLPPFSGVFSPFSIPQIEWLVTQQQQRKMNTLVQEDKIKFENPIKLLGGNHEFMVIVFESDRSQLVIRHIYNQAFKDLTTRYPENIASLHLLPSNHLVIVTETKQVDVVFLEAESSIVATNIIAFQKKGLVDVAIGESSVGILEEMKVQVLELREKGYVSKEKYELGGSALKIAFGSGRFYVLFKDNSVRRWAKSGSGKYEERPEAISLKHSLLDIKVVRNGDEDYLLCLSPQKQVLLLTQDGTVLDILPYQGEFQKLVLTHGLVTIVSRLKEGQIFTLYYAQAYQPQSSRRFFNKAEVYTRNTSYADCYLVPIFKKEWAVYSRRKGNKEMGTSAAISDEVFCLIYGKLENDPNKLEILKIDAAKVLNKDRELDPISRYKSPESPERAIQSPEPRREVLKEPKQPITVIKKMELSESCLRAVQKIVDQRITPLIDRIDSIERKLNHIETRISSLNSEESLSKLYAASLQKQVHNLFESKIVPKMQVYFQQIFADLAQVFNQGIQYYNQKLMVQTDLQKSTFKSLISHTMEVTKEIIDMTKADLPHTIKIDELLNNCVRKKDELLKYVEELLVRVEKGPFSYKPSSEKELKEEDRPEEKSMKSEEKKKKTFVRTNIE